jgi:hypothetical protein
MARQQKQAKKQRRERRAQLLAQQEERERRIKPVHSLDVPDESQMDDLPAISEILEEHRAANAGFGGLTRSAPSITPALSTYSSAKSPPPSSRSSFSKSSSSSHVSSSSSALPHPKASQSLLPATAPFSFQPVMPTQSTWSFTPVPTAASSSVPPAAAPASSSSIRSVPVPELPIEATYWPKYDTQQELGYKYVRGGAAEEHEQDDEQDAAEPASLAPAVAATPFQFDLSGFQPGVAATRKSSAAPIAASQVALSFAPSSTSTQQKLEP